MAASLGMQKRKLLFLRLPIYELKKKVSLKIYILIDYVLNIKNTKRKKDLKNMFLNKILQYKKNLTFVGTVFHISHSKAFEFNFLTVIQLPLNVILKLICLYCL